MTARGVFDSDVWDNTMRTLGAKNALTPMQALNSAESKAIPAWEIYPRLPETLRREKEAIPLTANHQLWIVSYITVSVISSFLNYSTWLPTTSGAGS